MSESQTPAQDQRCQSGPSAKNSFIPSEGDSSKNCGADQQRLQILDPHFDKFFTSAMFACWKVRFKTEECTCSQFPTEAMLWIKEVKLVDSVDDLKSSRSIRGTLQLKRKGSLEEQKPKKRTVSFVEDRSLT